MIKLIKDLLQKIEATLDAAALEEVSKMSESLIVSFTRERKIGAAFILRALLARLERGEEQEG